MPPKKDITLSIDTSQGLPRTPGQDGHGSRPSLDNEQDEDRPLPFPSPLTRSMFTDALEDTLNPRSPLKAFNVDDFLASRKHTALEDLRSELSDHLTDLRAELVELINRDYADFVNLSTNLKGLDKKMSRVRDPLRGLRSEVDGLKINLENALGEVEAKLQYRTEIRHKKAVLQLLVNISSCVSKVESLLLINVGTNGSSISNPEEGNSVKRIERVAIEYNQMLYLVNKGKDLPYVDEISWRITRIKDTLSRDLAYALRETLQELDSNRTPTSKTKFALTQCFRTYAMIDQVDEASKIVREAMVRPSLSELITKDEFASSNNKFFTPIISPSIPNFSLDVSGNKIPIQAIDEPLAQLYTKILTWVQNKCQILLDITQNILRGTSFDLLVNSIWVEIAVRLNSELGAFIFAAGHADTFHRNYSISMDFVSQFEDLCGSERTLIALRQHPSYQVFMKKWQLPVYFQLRFRQIASKCEETYQKDERISTDIPKSLKDFDNLILPTSRALLQSIRTCWSNNVYMSQLSHRFWRLTLQLIQRYQLWLQEAASKIGDPSKTSSSVISRANSGMSGGASADATEDIELREIIIVAHDVKSLTEQITEFFNSVILSQIGDTATNMDKQVMREAVDILLDELRGVTPTLSDRLISIVARRCIDVLRSIRTITGQYRHTNKKAPTEPSYFVPSILRPIRTIFDSNNTILVDDVKQIWVQSIADSVTQRYTSVMSDLLVTIKKTEDSLKRLKKSKNQGSVFGIFGGREEAMSDEDKIRLQCYLDVEAYAKDLESVGIMDLESFHAFIDLHDLVKEFSQLKKEHKDHSAGNTNEK